MGISWPWLILLIGFISLKKKRRLLQKGFYYDPYWGCWFIYRDDFNFWYAGSFEYDAIFRAIYTGSTSLHDYNNSDINFYRGDGEIRAVPLHTWLPDAMEGPTPVSALIHAATMVAAGVYLVATMFPLFSASTVAMQTVAIVGAFTAIFAASIGLVQTDIKRVLAYSTVSQLGYMMLALGSAGYVAGIFHLTTHAF